MQTLEFTKQALERSTKAVTMRPAVGQYTHKSIAAIEDGTRCYVRDKHFEIVTDVPPSIGGNGGAPTPGALMRCALSSCAAIGIKLWAARADIQIDYVEVEVEGDVDARGEMGVDDQIVPGFLDLRLNISIRSNADPAAIKRAIDQSIKYSPLIDAFSREHKIQTALEIAAGDDKKEGVISHA